MPIAAIMKKSNIVRALLVFMAISSTSTAAIYSARTGLTSAAPDIFAYKPSDVIFPGFVQRDLRQRPDGYRGFSGFVQEVRVAIQAAGGAPRTVQAGNTSFAENSNQSQTSDTTYESSVPIKMGKNSPAGETTEVYLGVSVTQILSEIPTTGPITGGGPATNIRNNHRQASGLSSTSVRGGSLSSSGNWLSGSFFSTGNSSGLSGFGFDLRPNSYSTDLGNRPYVSRQRSDAKNSKGLKALRTLVLDMFFNPFVYVSILIVAVLMFMARFRSRIA